MSILGQYYLFNLKKKTAYFHIIYMILTSFIKTEDFGSKDHVICVCISHDPGGSDNKESACNAEDLGLIPGLGRSPGEGSPLQYYCLENSMDKGA